VAKPIRMRKRDVSPKTPAPIIGKEEIVRLEALIGAIALPDLTPLEATLRANTSAIAELQAAVATTPVVETAPQNYRFLVHRKEVDVEGTRLPLIDYVDGIVVDAKSATLLERSAGPTKH